MAYFDKDYLFRHPVMSDRSGVATEHKWTVQKHHDQFWNNLADQTDAFDVIVTESDGLTLVPAFDYLGFDFATKTLTVRWNNIGTGSGAHGVFWIYWGKAGAADLTGAPTVAAPVEVLSTLMLPGAGRFVVQQAAAPPGESNLVGEVSATTDDEFITWVRVGQGETNPSQFGANESDKLYEVSRFDYRVTIAGFDESKDTPIKNRVAEDGAGITWFGVFTSGLVVDTDYTGIIHSDVVAPGEPTQALYSRFKIQCRNPDET